MPNCPNCGKPYNPGDEVCPDCGLVFPFTTDILAPSTVLQARYEIQELTHTGGMGYIYLAKDKKLYDRLCIVKQVKEPVKSDSDLKKLEEEARRMAKLSHPNVAMILDHFVENGYYLLVVEHISGKTLGEVFEERHGKLNEEEVVNWAITMCDVVSYIHEEGIIHRDISPDNIMLTEAGVIKFVDFGTLRELRYITTRGTAGMGKYGYTPPEQWQGKPTPQSDIFALGATIYYLLTGNLPLSKEYLSGQGPQKQDFSPNFPPIRQKNPEISTELEAVLQKALHLDVSNRYTSAAEFGQALRNLGKVAVPRRETVEAAKPVLSVDKERISFAEVKVGSRATRSLTIRNTGTGRLTGKITTSHPWLKVSPTNIDLGAGEQTVQVTVDARHLYYEMAHGIGADGEIRIDTNGGEANVGVSLATVAAAAKPEPVSLRHPVEDTKPVPMLPKRTIEAAKPATASVVVSKPAPRRKLVLFAVTGLVGLALLVVGGISILSKLGGVTILPSIIPWPGAAETKTSAPAPLAGKIAFVRAVSHPGSANEYRLYVMDADGSNQKLLSKDFNLINAPAWSPDCKKIAFVATVRDESAIYTVSADGSDLVRLTPEASDPSKEGWWNAWAPRWSPDGTKIAFQATPHGVWEIYVMNADGSNLTSIGRGGYPSWSPDGKRIVYVGDVGGLGLNAICAMDADGGNKTRLISTEVPQHHYDTPVWSYDGKQIAFIAWEKGNDRELYVMDADGSNVKTVASVQDGPFSPQWSPTGKKIAFIRSPWGTNNVCVMNADGTGRIYIPCSGNPQSMTWSPDGNRIALSNRGIEIANADGTGLTKIYEITTQSADFVSEIAWSASTGEGISAVAPPSKGKIAFVSDRDGNNEIYIMDADGSNQKRLTKNNADDYSPTWSPDGTKIAFSSKRDGNEEIYVMNADGSTQTRLTNNNTDDYSPTWSPDGTKIAFISERDGNHEVYVMNVDGSNQTRLTNNNVDDYSPEWLPDGSKIAFVSYTSVYVMNADGSNQTNLNADSWWFAWSPDGKKIAFGESTYECGNQICVINADGSSRTRLTPCDGSFHGPVHWSPDGKKILFIHVVMLRSEVYGQICTINVDGSNLVTLTDDPVVKTNPQWSPDGTKILYHGGWCGGPIYVMNATGGNQTRLTDDGQWAVWQPVAKR